MNKMTITLPLSQESGEKAIKELEELGFITRGPSTLTITHSGYKYIRQMGKEKPALVTLLTIFAHVLYEDELSLEEGGVPWN